MKSLIPETQPDQSERMIVLLREYGVVKVPGYVKEPAALEREVRGLLKSAGITGYKHGNACKLGPLQAQVGHPEIYRLFNQAWMRELTLEFFGGAAEYCSDIFITHEFRNDQGKDRNGFLHFDRYPAFKFFFYLSEVDEECGPFSCIPGSHRKGAELCEKAWQETGSYGEVKNRIFLDYPELGYSPEDIVPILGSAGDLIIFDTQTFHMGGVIHHPEKERLCIRGHSRIVNWKQKYQTQ